MIDNRKNTPRLFSVVLLMMGLLWGCGSGETDTSPVIAKYKSKNLTQNGLAHYLPEEINKEDSTRFADLYVERWLKEEAIVDVALNTIPELGEEVEFKVEDYRKKLILHEYTTHLIQDSLNREIPDAEIRTYYQQNQGDFSSNENLYQYFYISTAERNTREIREWMDSDKSEFLDSLRKWSAINALEYKLDSGYVGESRIREISKGYYGDLKKSRIGKLIRWNGVIQGQQRRYLFKMHNMVEVGDPLPFVLAKDKIRRILLNERKSQLIENVEERILKDARTNNYIQK